MMLKAICNNDIVRAGRVYEIVEKANGFVEIKLRKHWYIGMRSWFE